MEGLLQYHTQPHLRCVYVGVILSTSSIPLPQHNARRTALHLRSIQIAESHMTSTSNGINDSLQPNGQSPADAHRAKSDEFNLPTLQKRQREIDLAKNRDKCNDAR
jgi:hypothetical protein